MRQADLFEAPAPEPQAAPTPDLDAIRERLGRMLDEARQASAMPWDARTAGRYEALFPQVARWLPAEEADALCAAFRAELARLKSREPR